MLKIRWFPSACTNWKPMMRQNSRPVQPMNGCSTIRAFAVEK